MSIINTPNKKAAAWLSYLAYADPVSEIEVGLNKWMKDKFNGPYTLVWGPTVNEGILVYVVQDKNGTFLVACRGTIGFEYNNILGWLANVVDDLDSLYTQPWPYQISSNSNDGAFVTAGMTDAFNAIVSQTGDDLISGGSVTLQQFLQAHLQAESTSVIVTGHSLGGALANLIAPYLAYEFQSTQPNLEVVPFTFAAPTVSNDIFQQKVFAAYCKTSWQCVNSLDIIPMCWSNLAGVAGAYTPADWRYPLLLWDNPALWGTIKLAQDLIDLGGYNFTPVSAPSVFTGQMNSSLHWTSQVTAQHTLAGYYFQSLGLEPPPKQEIPNSLHIQSVDVKVPHQVQIGVKTKTNRKLTISMTNVES